MKIFLRDKNPSLVAQWEAAFSGYPDVSVSCGDIFGVQADAIISPANSFGRMDGGIDYAYSKYFGWHLQDALQLKIKEGWSGELPVGSAVIVPTGHERIRYLVSCPTMRVPQDVSRTNNAYRAFLAGLSEIGNFNAVNENGIGSVLCPGLGTLTGGISAVECARQMRGAYDQVFPVC